MEPRPTSPELPDGQREEAAGLLCRREVVYVLPYLGIGGTERHVLHLVERIVWERPPVVVAPDGPLRAALEAAGASVRVFVDPTGNWLQGVRSFRRAFREALGLVQAAGGSPVVHVHSAAELLWLARRWAPHAAFVFTDHGYFGPGAQLSYRLAGAVLRRTGAVLVVVSSPSRALWTRRLGIPEAQVRVIPNGVPDPTVRALAAAPPPWVDGQPGEAGASGLQEGGGSAVVGAVGRLEPQKGFEDLVEAFEEVVAEAPQARLVIVGKGSLRPVLLRRIQESRRLRGRVILAGEVPGAAAWVRHFTVFCQPSVAEALPLSLLEAMASGCAIVATCVGGMPEALGYGQAGLLVPPRDPEALAAAVLSLLQDAQLRERLGRTARQRYAEHFTDVGMARALSRLYEQL
jgi:glycosyltransferase involved in cell wall biosynthesis